MDNNFGDLVDLETLSLKHRAGGDENCNRQENEIDYEILAQKLGKSTIYDVDSDDVVYVSDNIRIKNENGRRSKTTSRDSGAEMPKNSQDDAASGWHLSNYKRGAKATLVIPGGKPACRHTCDDSQDNQSRASSTDYRPYPNLHNHSVGYCHLAQPKRDYKSVPWLSRVSNSPSVLWEWFRTIACIVVTSIVIYHGLNFAHSVARDITSGIEKRRQSIRETALMCQENYQRNKCATDMVPAMEKQCKEWEQCMFKNVALYEDSASVSAELYGGVINKFLSQFDAKNVAIFTGALIAFYVLSCWIRYADLSWRSSVPSWLPQIFSRMPQDGTQLFHSPQMIPPPPHHPYLAPNYTLVGNYPYVNSTTRSSYASNTTDATDSAQRYKDYQNYKIPKKKSEVWKRRFISEWEDAQ